MSPSSGTISCLIGPNALEFRALRILFCIVHANEKKEIVGTLYQVQELLNRFKFCSCICNICAVLYTPRSSGFFLTSTFLFTRLRNKDEIWISLLTNDDDSVQAPVAHKHYFCCKYDLSFAWEVSLLDDSQLNYSVTFFCKIYNYI